MNDSAESFRAQVFAVQETRGVDEEIEVEVESPPEPDTSNRTDWTRALVALAAAIVAISSVVIAWAQLEQVSEAREVRCLQRAQLESFAFRSQPSESEFRDRIAECGR